MNALVRKFTAIRRHKSEGRLDVCMQIPRRVDYGLRAVIYLSARGRKKCCSITEIATQQGVPKKFLEKIIQDLIRGGLIKSKRGACGGYALARSPEQISFSDVIEAIEGSNAVKRINRNRRMPMKHFSYLFVFFFLCAVVLTGCEVIGDIFKAGVWTGVLLVILVIGIIVWLLTRSKA
jgi:Rrf2 family protein